MCVTGSYSTMYSYRGHVYYILSRKTATKVMRPRSDQGSMYCTRLAWVVWLALVLAKPVFEGEKWCRYTRDTHCADTYLIPRTSTFAIVFPKLLFPRSQSMCPGNQTSFTMWKWLLCKLELARAKSVTVVAICLRLVAQRWDCHTSKFDTAVVPTILEKSVFYEYLSVASVSFWLTIQFVHCCLVTTWAFMPASLTVIPYTIVEISEFLGQLPVDDDDEKSQFKPSVASLF